MTATDTIVECPGCGAVGHPANDRFCTLCGSPLPGRFSRRTRQSGDCPQANRDHFEIRAAKWLAAVCDKGRRHDVNQDAAAVAAGPGRAVMVVCDGVSHAVHSEAASLAAANTACASLSVGPNDADPSPPRVRPADSDPLRERIERITEQLALATLQANVAVLAQGHTDVIAPPTCTLVAAVLEHNLLVTGNVGDSRAYWLPADPSRATQLGADDSWAQAMIAEGWDAALAQSSPRAHAITRWIGAGTPNFQPTCGWLELTEPGWVLLCSDGLWNYCSDPAELTRLVHGFAASDPDPVAVCRSLVDWANEQGGRDNITVVAARIDR